ncbi:YebG family protein [Marinomonas flavescens]|uniref:YebG family protein n=1 Tax=Marinomonas flavescens TaxID=2529379 RepID=UPI001054C324
MPVVIKYVVERDGIEKMTFTSKTEADAYDKLLDTADALYEVLDSSELAGDHAQKEALSMYLAENKETLLEALGAKRKVTPKSKTKSKKTQANGNTTLPLEDLVIEPDEDALYDEDENSDSFEDTESYIESDAA